MELEAPPSHQVKHPRFEDEKLPTAPNGLATQDSTLEVDLLILDYITYQATNACLSSRDLKPSTSFSLPNNLAMSDSLLALFQARHPGHQLDAELHFRLLLLKLTALFAQRLTRNPTTPRTSALEELRQNNQDRAREWIANEERIPSYGYNTSLLDNASAFPSHDILERNRAHVLHGLNVPDAIDEAFAWGLKAKGREEDANDEINDMFEDPVYETEVQGWANIKRQYLERLLPSATENSWRESSSVPSPPHGAQDGHRLVDLISRLENTATQHPIFQFESDVLGFLHALSESIERPVLVQVEAGQLDGMSTEETTEFIKSCGLSTGKLMLDSGVKREA
ncbi:hypothetical protein KC315_g7423 [Hortaea werneckii]|nr:hypothetical protein KC315_g7423 [Hortaea werneckii]